jgi:hypothetical protein
MVSGGGGKESRRQLLGYVLRNAAFAGGSVCI